FVVRRRGDSARSFLERLVEQSQQRLVAAMAVVEQLLTAGLVDIDVVDPGAPGAQYCVGEYFAELAARFPTGFDPALSIPAELDELRPPAGMFLLATLRREPVGCGALKLHGEQPADA